MTSTVRSISAPLAFLTAFALISAPWVSATAAEIPTDDPPGIDTPVSDAAASGAPASGNVAAGDDDPDATPAPADTPAPVDAPAGTSDLTILATTDVHGRVFDWDYFTDKAPDAGREVGLSRVGTAIEKVRGERGADSTLLVDNGDAIQGTPLSYLAAKQKDRLTGGPTHPVAQAFNLLKYDVTVVGNHEFNYGLDLLKEYEGQLDAPLLGANVVKAGTTEPWLTPWVMVDKKVDGKNVKVGVLGLVSPGVRVWDKLHVQGILDFRDMTEVAGEYVPQIKAAGADVVVVLAHSGVGDSTTWDPSVLEENTIQHISTRVNDIDVLIVGHSHRDVPVSVSAAPDGDPVVMTQPKNWAGSMSEVRLPLRFGDDGKPTVAWPEGDSSARTAAITGWVTRHAAGDYPATPTITDDPLLSADHKDTIGYVNTVVAQASEEMRAESSRWEDTPILDFIGSVMEKTVREGIKGTAAEGLPVIAQVSPFSRTAVFPKGNVSIKDIAGLYIYDNTLMGVEMTGAQLKDYLEFSAKYFRQLEPGATLNPDTDLNVVWNGRATPDYNYDALTGVTYTIDISKPQGQRIMDLRYEGKPVAPDQKFVLAINNYRASGGGGYPHVTTAPVVYDELVEIRQALIDHASGTGVIDPKNFFTRNWTLTTNYVAPGVDDPPSGGGDGDGDGGQSTPGGGGKPGGDKPGGSVPGDGGKPGGDKPGGGTPPGTNGDSGNKGGKSPVGAGAPTSSPSGKTTHLARTGGELGTLAGLGVVLVAIGVSAVFLGRRLR
ncbi:MAG: 5'-nucleotidase C-terminal domain-containing protein [Actinomycetaceae bacterium]|nr:5'-nucleotidase C-terminal domain-containing protein [Actinomycetaceae bacterium]